MKKKIFSSESEDDDASVVAKLPRKSKSLRPQLTYPKPPSLKATSEFNVMKNMDHIEKSKSDSDIEEEIDKYQELSNSSSLKNISDNSCEKNTTHNTSQEITGKNVITCLEYY